MGVRVSAVRMPSIARTTGMQDPVMSFVLYTVCGVKRDMCGGRIWSSSTGRHQPFLPETAWRRQGRAFGSLNLTDLIETNAEAI